MQLEGAAARSMRTLQSAGSHLARGGQVIGKTDDTGATVKDRPVSVQDLFRTLCHSLKIDADQENFSGIGRPIRIVDGGKPVMEAFA